MVATGADAGMSDPATERALLERLVDGPVSGDLLAREAGQTRAAVWKRIETLREAGIAVAAVSGRGYQLEQPLDLLDAAAIRSELAPSMGVHLASLDIAWSLDSTNSELLRRALPEKGCAVLLAERQTGGRGRRGRRWASPLAAHVYLSIGRHFEGGLARLGGLSLVAGIAACEALRELGYRDVGLKWPNDLVVADGDGNAKRLRKLGGLLVEGGGEHAGAARAVIGLGVNVHMPVAMAASIDQPWVDLAALSDSAPSRNAVVVQLLKHLLPALAAFDANGLAAFLPRFAALDALAGRDVRIHEGMQAWPATALGIAADGALRVRDGEGRERQVHAADVSLRHA